MKHGSKNLSLTLGSLALFAGLVATLVTAYAVVSHRNTSTQKLQYHYDGWDDDLGL